MLNQEEKQRVIEQLKAGKDIPFWIINLAYHEIKQDQEAWKIAQGILEESRNQPILNF